MIDREVAGLMAKFLECPVRRNSVGTLQLDYKEDLTHRLKEVQGHMGALKSHRSIPNGSLPSRRITHGRIRNTSLDTCPLEEIPFFVRFQLQPLAEESIAGAEVRDSTRSE